MLTDAQRAALTARVRRGRTAAPDARIARRPAGVADPAASYGQEQLWFLDRFAPGRSTYNLPCPVAIRGPLDAAALDRALAALTARHEALRTRLVAGEHSHPVQVIDPASPGPASARRLDYADPDRAEARRRLRELAASELQSPFELSKGPLLRAHLVRLADQEHVLLLTVHHCVFDGWSAGVLVRDLAALYRAEVTGEPTGLDELPVQFADYAVWERERLAGPAGEELAAWWRRALGGAQTLRLATDRPRPPVNDFDGREESRALPPGLLDDLRELSRREGATLFATLMAGLHAVLHRYTGQDDLVVGTTSANRRRAALTPLIGFLVNTLPIRCDASGDPPFTEFLGRVREAMVGAYEHQDLPFARIVAVLGGARDASRAPVVQVMFNLVEDAEQTVPAGGVTFGPAGPLAEATESKFDISLFARTGGDQFTAAAIYASALFDAATIGRLLGHLEVLLAGVVADPSARLSELPLLTQAERHAELVSWNDAKAPRPEICVHEGFAAQVARTPGGVAAEFEGGGSVSYADLNRQANQIARRLRELGVGPEVLVGVCMRAGLTRLAALLGIWKAGGGYVPLDPALPADRLAFMITDAGMPLILTDPASLTNLPATATRPAAASSGPVGVPLGTPQGYQRDTHTVVDLEAERERIAALDDTDLTDNTVTPGNVAYVIYTSGSTGRPKGVVVEHRQAVNFLLGMIETWDMGPADAVLQFASLSFDVSVMDMFVPLLAGGRVVLAPAETLHSPPRLAALMREAGVTFACLTPSVLALLAGEDFPALRALVSGGEELSAELTRAWLRPGLGFYNTYGPTEAAVVTTHIPLDSGTLGLGTPPPIGRPLPNYQAYVLDERLSPVPAGVIGELHVGGAGVARGYLSRPELTRERFIPDPFRPGPGSRLYKTGDLVRRRADGTIAFVGRADGQVKISGLRIELGEVEAALLAHPGVARAVAAVRTGRGGDRQLAAWFVAQPDAPPDAAALRAHLARTLPGYMIPAELTPVAAIPLSNSGKADRAALLAARPVGPAAPDTPAAPAMTPPATFTETVLADSFATVLGGRPAGARDSFFDLGGSSLQVMRLVDLIHAELGADVGVTEVFLHPTPRQLAARIDAQRSAGDTGRAGPLVRLSRGPGELPLFLVHAVGGTVFSYAPLARELAGTFAVSGLEAPGLHRAATPPSLAALADDYTGRIRAAQPDGRYRLAGWSMGGVVAFEITRRLERAGAEVSLLALLDAPYALADSADNIGDPYDAAATEAHLAARFLADATHSLGWTAVTQPVPPDPAAATAAEQLDWLAARLAPDEGRAGVAARLRTRFEVFQAHVRMLAGYQPAGPPVRAPALIVSAQGSPNAPAAERWPAVLGGPVTALPVPGDHYQFLRPPLVAEVATTMEKWHGDPA